MDSDDAISNINQIKVGGIDTFGSIQIDQPDNRDYLMAYDLPIGALISQLSISPQLGNGHVSVLINGTKVTGIDTVPIAANTRSRFAAQGNNILNPGDDVWLRVEDGAGSLLGIKASIVRTNAAQLGILPPAPAGLVTNSIAFTGTLANNDLIQITPPAPLRRNPFLFKPIIIKNSPAENDIEVISTYPLFPNDFTQGWIYVLSDLSVPNQILAYSYML